MTMRRATCKPEEWTRRLTFGSRRCLYKQLLCMCCKLYIGPDTSGPGTPCPSLALDDQKMHNAFQAVGLQHDMDYANAKAVTAQCA